ncbi:MAG: class I SAM-dependent methyltransferase [Bacteroidales bacterium]|nr:class I SAM-dependent methyltransferase [Bacteroidales bacterium]
MRLVSYINYRVKARTRYSVHSPFVYDFIEKVIRGKGKKDGYIPAETTRARMFKDNRSIIFEDFGTGGQYNPNYSIRISQIARRSAKRKKEGRLLARLAAWQKPAQILELGTSLGISTLYLAAACPYAEVITLEGCREVLAIAENNFNQQGMSNIRTLPGPFEETLPQLLSDGSITPGLVLFDGNHQYQPTLNYFEQLLPLARPSTIFVFDDIHWSAGMEKAWEEICSRPEISLSIDIFSMGIVFFKAGFTKQHFILHF